MPIQHQPSKQQLQKLFHPQMVAFARPEPQPPLHTNKQQQQQQQLLTPFSDDEEGGMDDNPGAADDKRKSASSSSSPWQRMKWTDAMVRLLIMAVYYIGDECGPEPTNSGDAGRKKAGSLMQKKGKWKSVSKAMMEKGCFVSPQQCEDKFNDLNKRFKRVNEILGKETACRVVENQSLLDRMDHLSPKSKEGVRKLLNSKHLFFREMCAYHNSCGANGNLARHHSPRPATQQPHHHHHNHNSSHDTTADNNPSYDDSDEESGQEEEGEDSEQLQVRCSTKRHREEELQQKGIANGATPPSSLEIALRGLEAEMGEATEDGRRSGWEKKRWMKMRMVKVEEERVGKEKEGLEIEKERLKWVKYCGKKEREMEKKRLRNERAKLECDRMVLLLKHKEFEMMGFSKNRASADHQPPSSVTACLALS